MLVRDGSHPTHGLVSCPTSASPGAVVLARILAISVGAAAAYGLLPAGGRGGR